MISHRITDMFAVGLGIFTIGSIAAALAPSAGW